MFNMIKIEKNFFLSLLSFATSLNSTLDISKYFCLSIRNIEYKYRSKRSKRIKLFSRVLIIVDRYKCNRNNEKKDICRKSLLVLLYLLITILLLDKRILYTTFILDLNYLLYTKLYQYK